MATDFGEKEREFIDGLKENTGRDLGEWMQAISEAGLGHRNDIIDWLRHKGLMFSKASWLERIHHNGGKPIYAGVPKEAAPRRPALRRRETPIAPLAPAQSPEPPQRAPAPAPAPPAPPAVPSAGGDVDALLAKAKAYRPLAQHVLAKIKSVNPAAQVSARESAVAIGGPSPFAVLGITAKELRLHLALGEHPFDEFVKKGQAGGGLGKGEALSHMLVLTDARQIDARFIDLITLAAARAGG
ncbi:hypothetical protein GIW81_05010 [Hyphomicrobium sp. xq]|uniref:DUF5655 domain-containing protein n=1 Tax=Hyphomicrobium album TaxID=2665159 RepID=A0A6I3KH40_9HYPH|nr:DUF5655 domain-containing protein [Hyphomicrobium album]MTD93693.1 hypothetical protein [Hyphomicrobium album]